MSLKFCSICKKSTGVLNHWVLNSEKGYICNDCLKDISHFIQENDMPEWLIWQNLENWNSDCVRIGIDYLDELPKTTETLNRLKNIKCCNSYLQKDIDEFIEELDAIILR